MRIDRFVSVITPLHDDAEIAVDFVTEAVQVLASSFTGYELVLVDDGSRDDTVARLGPVLRAAEGVRLLRLSRRFGSDVAISAGLDSVIGDYVVVMLAHMDPPALLPQFVEAAMQGADVVVGVRRTRSGQPWRVRAGSTLFYWYCARFLGLDLPRDATQLRCLSRRAVNAIIQVRDPHRYLRQLSWSVGFSRAVIAYDPRWRGGRVKPRRFLESLDEAVGVVVENSPQPLRLVTWLSLAAALSNLVYAGYVFAVYLLKDHVAEGWVTLSLQSAVQFFLLALILTALSEYVGRMMTRLGTRPLYYVMEEHGSSVLQGVEDRRNVVEESRAVDVAPGAGS
jgi:glycosyltransferase involved in cell wall biosynthesis